MPVTMNKFQKNSSFLKWTNNLVLFRKYSIQRILNVEENHDQGTGDRYLVEIELKEISSRMSARFSEYLYRPWGAETLCTPVGVAWNKSAVINIILSTGNNQGRWILHFLDNMAKIYSRTKDSNFNVIIADFDSKDLDLENALKKAAIPGYQYVIIKEKFKKVVGLQQAAAMIADPNSIVFIMDLHIDIPYHLLDDVRKVSVLNNQMCTAFFPRGYRIPSENYSRSHDPSHPMPVRILDISIPIWQ